MVKISMNLVATFHVDSEEKSALAISYSPVIIIVTVCIVTLLSSIQELYCYSNR